MSGKIVSGPVSAGEGANRKGPNILTQQQLALIQKKLIRCVQQNLDSHKAKSPSFSGAVRLRSPAYLFSVTPSRSWRRRRLSVTGVMPRNEAICLLLTESIIPG